MSNSPVNLEHVERGQSQSRLSLVAVDSADVVLDERKMYAVEWRDGATFGFTVTPVNSDRGTVLLLARRTARREQLETSGLQDVVPGDLLVAIGDEKVYHLGAEHATKYLRSVKKPVRLTLQLSPYGNQAKQLPDLAPNEYHYLWEEGPLGIVLTYDPKSKLPMVKRLSDKANDTVRRDVEVSDQLIYCNDVPTSEYSMDEVMSILREMPKPVLLRFRKQLQDDHLVELPELAENEYEFLWDYGPLGLVIGMSRSGLPFVRSFTGLGTSRQLNLVQEDDEIVMVNDKSAKEEGFRETMQYLMNVPKPAVLRFRRKMRNTMDDRASQARASAVMSNAARASTPGYLPPTVPDCVGPLSPVRATNSNYDAEQTPLSPQVRVSLDRSRFRSVSSSRQYQQDDTTGSQGSDLMNSSASPARQTQQFNGEGFEDAQSPQSKSSAPPGSADRETAILPPDPLASRSSIFTFRFEDEQTLPPTTEEAKPRRLAAKTGSMPPDLVVEPMAQPDVVARSQSVRPGSNTPHHTIFVPLPEPASKERTSVAAEERKSTPAAAATIPPSEVPTNERSSRGSKPAVDTAELVAEPVAKPTPNERSSRGSKPAVDTAELIAEPVVKPTPNERSSRGSKPAVDTAELVAEPVVKPAPKVLDTAELVADPVPVQPSSPTDNQREVGPKALSQAQSAKPTPSPAKNRVVDTAELVAEPAPKPTKKAYVDTADLVAEPVKVEKTVVRSKKDYIDTAELFAEPVAPKNPTPPKSKYVDTAELVAEPIPAPTEKKEKKAYVDTADLVAAPAPPPKAKPAYIDTAELFAEPAAPNPAAVTPSPASAPVPAAPTPSPTPSPASAPATPAKAAPATPLKPASSVESTESFTVDPAAFYTVQWTEGPFGSTVREADSNTGPVMLITKRTGKQTCAGLRRIAVGDILVRIGDKEVSAMGFEKATRYLRKVTKPVPLTFQAID